MFRTKARLHLSNWNIGAAVRRKSQQAFALWPFFSARGHLPQGEDICPKSWGFNRVHRANSTMNSPPEEVNCRRVIYEDPSTFGDSWGMTILLFPIFQYRPERFSKVS
ncbi:MAG: hypothetical protein ACJ8CG_09155, partial [Microvirga sp.]